MPRAPITAIPLVLRLAAIGVGLGVPIYWWFTYSGLYRWLAEVQIGWFDGYYAILTGVLSIALFFLPLVALLIPLSNLFERPPTPQEARAAQEQAVSKAVDQALITDAWLQRNFGWLLLGILVVGLGGTGAWFQVRVLMIGEKAPLDLAALEAGTTPQSTWVEFDARPSWFEGLSVKGKHTTRVYAPVRSSAGRPAALLVEVFERKVNRGRTAWTGLLTRRPPGLVATAIAKRPERFNPEPWVLEVDATPESVQQIATVMFGTAGMFLGIGLIIGLVRRRRSR